MLSVPHRAQDDKFTNSIEGYRGSIHKLGRLLAHDWFSVCFGDITKERYLFLFKARILISKVRRISEDRSVFQLKDIIKLPQVEIKDHPDDLFTFELIDKIAGHSLTFTSHRENVKDFWLTEIKEFASEAAEESVEDLQILSSPSSPPEPTQRAQEQYELPGKTKENIVETAQKVVENILVESSEKSVEIKTQIEEVEIQARESKKEVTAKQIKRSSEEEELKKQKVAKLDNQEPLAASTLEQVKVVESSVEQVKVVESKTLQKLIAEEAQSKVLKSENTKLQVESKEQKSEASKIAQVTKESVAIKIESDSSSAKQTVISKNVEISSSKLETTKISSEPLKSTNPLIKTHVSAPFPTPNTLSASVLARDGSKGDLHEYGDSFRVEVDVGLKVEEEVEVHPTPYGSFESEDMSGYSRRSLTSDTSYGSAQEGKYTSRSVSLDASKYSDRTSSYKSSRMQNEEASYSSSRTRSTSYDEAGAGGYSSTRRSLGDGDVDYSFSRRSIKEKSSHRLSHDADDDLYSTRRSERLSRMLIDEEEPDDYTLTRKYGNNSSYKAIEDTDALKYKSYNRTSSIDSETGSYKHSRKTSIENDDKVRYPRTTSVDSETGSYKRSKKSIDESLDPDAYLTKIKTKKCEAEISYTRNISIESESAEEDRLAKFEKYSRRSSQMSEDNGKNNKTNETDSFQTQTQTTAFSGKTLEKAVEKSKSKDIGMAPPDETPKFTKTMGGSHIKLTEEEQLEINKPDFVIKLKDTELLEGTFLRFMVKVKGNPHPDVTFFKDEKKIDNGQSRVSINRDHSDHEFYEIVIPDVTKKDAGVYKCIAVNEHGEASCQACLTVTDNKSLFDDIPDKETLLPKGEKPSFIWRKDGSEFEAEERFKVLMGDDEDSLALIFQHVRPEDAGLYTCVAQTSTGHISCSAELTVQGTVHELHREPEKPQLVIEKREAISSIGATCIMELQVKGFPPPKVSWKHEGVPIEASGKYKFLYEDEESMSLVIKNVEPTDAGRYEITAENELGQDIREMHLTVKAPPSIKKMADTSAATEQELKMTAEIEGIPKPTVQFYKDGKALKSNDLISIVEEGNKHSIIIKKTTLKDSGSFSVVATNEMAQVSQFWNLDIYCKPKIMKKLGEDISVMQQTEVDLSIRFESEPAPEITWYKDDKEITSDGHYIISKDGDSYHLKISGTVTTDSANYKVKAKNIHGTVEDGMRIDVKRAPTVTKGLSDITATEGDTNVTFNVKVDSYPKPSVKWFLDEIDITENQTEYKREESSDGASLIIKEVKREQRGTYTCKIINELGETSTSAKLTINCKPRITKHLKDTTVEEGATLHLEVEVDATPEATVKWLRNGREVSADARIKISRDTQRKENYFLTANLIKYEEQGEYEVEITNTLGTVSSKCQVTVQTLPVLSDSNMDDRTQFESLETSFSVTATAHPEPQAVWTLNGEEIKPGSNLRFKISKEADTFKLDIINLHPQDEGVYECTVKNCVGEFKRQAKLNITAERELRRPKIVEGQALKNQTIIKKKPVTFKAVIIGDPVPDISWLFNGNEMTADDFEPYKMVLESDVRDIQDGLKECTFSLTIPKCERINAGDYGFKVKNKWGEADSSAKLTVVLCPEIEGPDFVKVVPGDSTQLTCKIQANPPPVVTWTKSENVVEPTDDIEIIEDVANETYTLKFHKVQLSDSGDYKVYAKNEYGTADSFGSIAMSTEKPQFITGITDVQVEQGGEVSLMVRADGLPRPELKWYLNRNEIVDAPELQFATISGRQITSTLTITNFNEKDVGIYKVTATNVVGEAETTARLGMTQTPPTFAKRLERSEELNEGEPLVLKAKVAGSPKPQVAWFKDGERIDENDERIKIEYGPDGNVKLSIDEVKPGDSGAYKLVIWNPNGETAGLCAVAVNAKPQRPKFKKCIKDTKGMVGEQLKLVAQVSGHPPPEVKWLKDGQLVRPTPNVHLEHHPDGTIALVIDNVRPENAGKYTLLVTNKLGEATGEASVEVEKRPIKPDFVKKLFDQTVVEGYPVKMEVKAIGFPEPKITWTRNGAEVISDKKHIKVTDLPEGVSILVIEGCDEVRDSIEYVATAVNEAGEAVTKATLKVTPASKGDEPEERPIFLHALRDVITDEGQQLKLEAPFTGNPIPSVEWTKDGAPITPSDRVLLTCDGKKVGLLIDKSLPSDAGQYGVTITNPLGTESSQAKASVHKVFQPPTFTQRFNDLQQLPTRDAKFPARVSGVPQPEVTWSKDGQPIKESDKYRIKRDGDACCLYIADCQPEDEGSYMATVTNQEGQDTCMARLEVVKQIKAAKKMEPANFVKKIGDTELYKGMTAKFTACAAGMPEPEVEWYRNDQRLYPADRIRMEMDRNGLLRLNIAGVDQDDLGKYTCKIFNEHGSDVCEAYLKFDEGLDSKPKRPITDQYADYDRYKKTGAPMPLSDAPIISRMTDRHCTLSWKPSIPSAPRAPVTYQLEMLELPHGDWFTVRSGIRSCCCDVRNLEPFRDYKFRVRVENKYGISDPSPFAITYREKIEPEPPKFMPYLPPGIDFRPETSPYFPKDFDIERPPHDNMAQAPRFLRQEHDAQYGVKDHNANLFWYVYGYPKPKMSYYFNDELIEPGGRFDTSYTRNGQATLFINKMLDRDVGWYEAVASNEHGEARQRVRLEIAEAPTFIRRPDIEYVMVRDKARFEARIAGVPYPEIKWYRDWKPLANSTRIKIQFIEPDTSVLVISDAIFKDEGLYSVSARNVAGSISSSAMLHVEENDLEYNFWTYKSPIPTKLKKKPYLDAYDIGDELGRGTQGVTYHAVERLNGRNYAAKLMHGRGDFRPMMHNEWEIMSQLHHRRLIYLHDAYEHEDSFTLITELAAGGELVKDYLLKMDYYTESDIAGFIRQILQGLQYMHERGFGHMGLTLGDLLLSHPGSDELKICDFGLSRRIQFGRLYPLKFGVPEFVSPEAANGEGTGLGHDMWSVGIITYILLSGRSPFRGAHDMETLQRIQSGKWSFDESWWCNISLEARDFITKLLVYQAEGRMDVHAALRHPWLERADKIRQDEYRISTRYIRDWFVLFREWYDNASCRNWYRRRPLEGAFTHPSKMVYPPGERYTPPPGAAAPEKVPRKPKTWEEQIPSRSPLNYEIGSFKSESHYQNGPDTYLLQLRDVDFPVRLREYMKVAGSRGAAYAHIISNENGFDWHTPVIRERRRFTDIMDEEIDDERKVRISKYGSGDSGYTIRRLRHEIGTRLDTYAEAEAFLESKMDGRLPFFREKPQVVAMQEGKDLEMVCLAVGDPTPVVQWFKNDAIIAESHRIKIEVDEDGRSHFKLCPALSFDLGTYKVVARNKIGQTIARTYIVLGTVPDAPDSPEATQVSEDEALLHWKQPKDDGHSPVICYSVQFKLADDMEWSDKATNVDHEFYLVRDLEPGKNYIFRLAAKNAMGWSSYGVASAVIMTKPVGAPKVKMSKAMEHLQQITDTGVDVVVDSRSKLDYDVENNPIEWITGDPQEKYNFISEISRGKFSTVLKALDRNNDSVVVAKVIETRAQGEDLVEGEFAALRSLRNERIATLNEAYKCPDGTSVFILEKLQGADVLTYLASRHEYSEQTVATIVTQVLNGLQYLHWRGLCHLDLQPDNVVMCTVRSVQVKLVDFGCAHRVTKLGNRVPAVGHPDYISPEVLNDEPAFPQSDIWSVGVLTYLMLSGTLPFRGEDANESRQNISFVRYRFEHLYKEVSQEGVRFVMLLFKRHPNKRPTAEECHENRWLLPTDFMIKKRERAVFLGNRLKEYCDVYHAEKAQKLTTVAGKAMRSHSIDEELSTAPF